MPAVHPDAVHAVSSAAANAATATAATGAAAAVGAKKQADDGGNLFERLVEFVKGVVVEDSAAPHPAAVHSVAPAIVTPAAHQDASLLANHDASHDANPAGHLAEPGSPFAHDHEFAIPPDHQSAHESDQLSHQPHIDHLSHDSQ